MIFFLDFGLGLFFIWGNPPHASTASSLGIHGPPPQHIFNHGKKTNGRTKQIISSTAVLSFPRSLANGLSALIKGRVPSLCLHLSTWERPVSSYTPGNQVKQFLHSSPLLPPQSRACIQFYTAKSRSSEEAVAAGRASNTKSVQA